MKKIKTALVLASVIVMYEFPAWAEGENKNLAEVLKTMGKVYSDGDDPTIQEVKLFGRLHYQWNHSDGDSNGEDFSGNGDELRRLRAGASVKFLDRFTALGRLNLEKGGHRNTSIGYSSFDELYLESSQKNLFGFDSAKIGYGRYKVRLGGEEHESSKRIKTIERSNINNRFGSIRPTGLLLQGEKNGTNIIAGVFSTKRDRETWSQWDGGTAFYASIEREALEGNVIVDFIHANDSSNDQTIFDYNWATSLTYTRSFEKIDFFANVTYSDTEDGDIYGFVLMPSTYIIDDKLEAVARYQWGQATTDGAVPRSSSSRGLRRAARNDGLSTGGGDDNHTLYAGLNYYLEGHYLKIMTGIEYEKINGNIDRDLSGYTFWTALRTYF
tara:strand:+ start:6772 stop:7923 length:1152 start_codon:yes stop_codon:yes gene_type:complete